MLQVNTEIRPIQHKNFL